MKADIAFFAIVFVLAVAFGCGETPPPREDTKQTPPATPVVEKPLSPVEKAAAALKEAADKALANKSNGASEVEQLKSEKEVLVKERELAQAKVDEAEGEVALLEKSIKGKDTAIAEARDRAAQERIYWYASILGLVALLAGVAAFAFPLVRRWAGGIALGCAAMAGVAVFAAWLIPYLWWVGGVLVASAVIGALVAWKHDVNIGDAVISTVEDIKHDIPNYKERLRARLHKLDKSIDRRREQLGLK